jgi:hypothetical protein
MPIGMLNISPKVSTVMPSAYIAIESPNAKIAKPSPVSRINRLSPHSPVLQISKTGETPLKSAKRMNADNSSSVRRASSLHRRGFKVGWHGIP